MGDSDAVGGALTRRRRATLAAGRAASLLPMNGRSAAVCESSVTADTNRDQGGQGRRDRSLETVRSKSKSEKKKRRNDFSDRLRWVNLQHV